MMGKVTKQCLHCGKFFPIHSAWIKKGGGKYCSTKCRGNAKSKDLSYIIKCSRPECDVYFRISHSRYIRGGRFCSRSCLGLSKRIDRRRKPACRILGMAIKTYCPYCHNTRIVKKAVHGDYLRALKAGEQATIEIPCRSCSGTERNKKWYETCQLTFRGKKQSATDWARELSINPVTLHGRLRRGWTVEEALTTPVQETSKMITFQGKTQCLTDWAREYSMSIVVLSYRLKQGWTIEKALTTPVRKKSTSQQEALQHRCHPFCSHRHFVKQVKLRRKRK